MRHARIPDLRALRRPWKQEQPLPHLTDAQRAQRWVWRAHRNEHNRQVKLENRADAAQRVEAAKLKRSRRCVKRRVEILAQEYRTWPG